MDDYAPRARIRCAGPGGRSPVSRSPAIGNPHVHTARLRPLLLAALLGCSFVAGAAPSNTLTYQGRLGSASGTPIDGARSITFRLYFEQAGVTSYWTETQTVTIDDGRFAVELGAITPLPDSLFGEQLFLGIQVAGDVEMTPRLKLTATPYASRARSLLRGTIHVPADGTPVENGNALRAAVASATAPAADNRYVVDVDAGDFDLGTASLVLPSHVSLTGAGAKATRIQGEVTGATLVLSSNTGLSALGVLNTGAGGTLAQTTAAVQVADAATDVAIDDAYIASMPAGATQGTDVRSGISFTRATRLVIDDVDIAVERGTTIYGLRASVSAGAPTETGIVVRDTRIAVSSATNVRGVDISGRMELDIDGLDIRTSAGTMAPTDTLGFRVQLETALIARGLDIDMDYAASTPNVLRGININRSASVDISEFRIDIDTAGCTPTGFRNAIVAFNPAATGLLAPTAPRFRNGTIEVDTTDCFAGGIYSSGSAPVMDNLRITATGRGAGNQGAAAYQQRTSGDACEGSYTMPLTASLSNSTLTATAESGFAPAVDTCVGDLAIENSVLVGTHTGFRAGDNSVSTPTFRIQGSQLKGTLHSALITDGEGTGRVFHTVFETPFTPVVAFDDTQTLARSKIACLATTTTTTFTAGPICPCTAGADCPSVP